MVLFFLVPSILIDERYMTYGEVQNKGHPRSLYPNMSYKDALVYYELMKPNCDYGKPTHISVMPSEYCYSSLLHMWLLLCK